MKEEFGVQEPAKKPTTEKPLASRRSREQGDKGKTDVKAEKGNEASVVGKITPEIAKHLPLQKEGDIVLTQEDKQHIENSHGEEIRSLGYSDAAAFVDFVLGNADAVYQGNNNRTFQIIVRNKNPLKQVVLKLEFSDNGDFYKVKTAGPLRSDFFKGKTPLWEKAQSNRFLPGEGDARNTSAKANTQLIGTSGASTVSTSGDTSQSGILSGVNIAPQDEKVNTQPESSRYAMAKEDNDSRVFT